MHQNDPLIEKYHALNPGRFPVLTKLEVRQPRDEFPEVTLALELRCADLMDKRALCLTFFKVWNLRYVPSEYPPFYQRPLSIVAISQSEGEPVSYRVFDPEGGDFSFLCVGFDAVGRTGDE